MAAQTLPRSKLAIKGGEKAVRLPPGNTFTWPIITEEDEAAVLETLRSGKMSGTDVTEKFEKEFAAWQGTRYALGMNNGTAALHSAMWAAGVRHGTEIIAPTLTYWATLLPALNLGAGFNSPTSIRRASRSIRPTSKNAFTTTPARSWWSTLTDIPPI